MCDGGCDGTQLPSGAAGADGLNAFTVLTAGFTQPSVGSNVTIAVSASGQYTAVWAVAGQTIYIAGGGYYEVISVGATNAMTVKNLGYSGNASPTSTVTSGGKVSPAGPIGASGSAGSNGSNGADGANGTTLLFNDFTHARRTANSYGTVKTYAIPADTLETAGDVLRIEAIVIGEASASYSTNYKFKMELGGIQCGPEVLALMDDQDAEQNGLKLVLDIAYLTNTTFTGKADKYALGGGILYPSASSSTDHLLTTAKVDSDSARWTGSGVAFDGAMNLVLSTMSNGTKNIVVCNVKITKYKI